LSRRRDAVIQTMSSPELPLLAKLQFIQHGLWLRSRPTGSYTLRFSQGEIALSYADNETDRNVIRDVFMNRCYGNDFHDSTVIDIGAHKGYFGAYALMHGAKRVVSYEPELQNFEFLSRTAQSFKTRGGEWETRRSAVTARNGEVELRVDPSSWAHSIVTARPSLATGANTHVVAATAMTDAVASATASSDGDRLVTKIDAEGAECEIVLETPVEVWQGVEEVFIEFHDFATCSRADIVGHLKRAGHVLMGESFGVIHTSRSTT
jgi:FkbM family methyltransferase